MEKRSIRARLSVMIMVLMVLSLIVSACSSKDEGTPTSSPAPSATPANTAEPAKPVKTKEFSNEPVTLKVATPWGEDYFMTRIGNYVQETLPHITLEHVDWEGKSEQMQELFASGIVPDVLLAFSGQKPLEELEMVFPLEEMLGTYGFDLSAINPAAVAEIRARDSEGRLVGMPQEIGFIALHYNKEIFDKFGVEYPKEKMTWDETLELARKLTDERDGIKYRGLEFGPYAPLMQLSVTLTNPETGEVLLAKEPKIAKYLELMEKYFSIPGINDPDSKGSFQDKTVAMSVNWHGLFRWFGGKEEEEAAEYQSQMDIAPIPYWADLPETSTIPTGIHPYVINSFSKNKEAALQFLIASVSPDYQTILAKSGTPSVLADKSVNAQFGADLLRFEGKHVGSFTKYKLAQPPKRNSYWDRYVNLDLGKFAESDMNIAEFLRKTHDEAQMQIKVAMAVEAAKKK